MTGRGEPSVLVFGADSMVGSDFVARLQGSVAAAGRVHPADRGLRVERFHPVDLSLPAAVGELVRSAPEPTVVNFAARTDVDGVERERGVPTENAWVVNALAPEAIARAAAEVGKRFIQLSTDFVFDGTNGPYGEEAARAPFSDRLSWYGWTKSEGERRAALADRTLAIVRIAYPYRAGFPAKLDFARWILAKRRDGTLPSLYGDQQITPTWVPDVTETLQALLARPSSGTFHVASPETTTPWEFGTELVRVAEGAAPGLPRSELAAVPSGSGRAPRPLRGGLVSRRVRELGVRLTSWREGIGRLVREEGGLR